MFRTWIACMEYMWMWGVYECAIMMWVWNRYIGGYGRFMLGIVMYKCIMCCICEWSVYEHVSYLPVYSWPWEQWDQAQLGIACWKAWSDEALINSSMHCPPLVGVLSAVQQLILPASPYPTGNSCQADTKGPESQCHRISGISPEMEALA